MDSFTRNPAQWARASICKLWCDSTVRGAYSWYYEITLFSCQVRRLLVPWQIGRWKTRVGQQALFSLGKKAHQPLPHGCSCLLDIWEQNVFSVASAIWEFETLRIFFSFHTGSALSVNPWQRQLTKTFRFFCFAVLLPHCSEHPSHNEVSLGQRGRCAYSDFEILSCGLSTLSQTASISKAS